MVRGVGAGRFVAFCTLELDNQLDVVVLAKQDPDCEKSALCATQIKLVSPNLAVVGYCWSFPAA